MFLTSEWFVDDFGNSSISHLKKPVGPLGDYRIMSNHHDCRVFLSGNFVHHTDHLRSCLRVKVSSRFIGENDSGSIGESSRYRYPLLFSATELVRQVPSTFFEAYSV